MIKKILLLIILLLFLPRGVFAQSGQPQASVTPQVSVSPQATSSPQVRNRLQLLNATSDTERIYQRFYRRLKAYINRLEKINDRLENRLTKLAASSAVANRLGVRLDGQAEKVEFLKTGYLTLNDGWKEIMDNKEPGDYVIFKKKITGMLNEINSITKEQKAVLAELKKYKTKIKPTQKPTAGPSIEE